MTQKVKTYERTTPKQITIAYTCQRCGRGQEYIGYPTKQPKYCPDCAQDVRREQNREAQRRRRGKA